MGKFIKENWFKLGIMIFVLILVIVTYSLLRESNNLKEAENTRRTTNNINRKLCIKEADNFYNSNIDNVTNVANECLNKTQNGVRLFIKGECSVLQKEGYDNAEKRHQRDINSCDVKFPMD